MADVDSGLDISFDRSIQERFWFWERLAWAFMFALVLAALGGLTGTSGPASSGRAESGEATVEFPRISRWQASDSFSIEFPASASGTSEVLIPNGFIDVFAIESITPQPSKVTATSEGHLFEFSLAAAPGRKLVNFAIRPERPVLPTKVRGTVDGVAYAFTFFVLP